MPLYHLFQRCSLPGNGPSFGPDSRGSRPSGDLPTGSDLLRSDPLQHRIQERGSPAPGTDFLKVFGDSEVVVAPSASCVAMIREHYPELASEGGEDEVESDVRALAARTYEMSEFLVGRLGVEDVGATFEGRVALHQTCHSRRGIDVGDAPERLLRKVKGLELVGLPNALECCGFGGTFSVKNPDSSLAMLSDKIQDVEGFRGKSPYSRGQLLPHAHSGWFAKSWAPLGKQRSRTRIPNLFWGRPKLAEREWPDPGDAPGRAPGFKGKGSLVRGSGDATARPTGGDRPVPSERRPLPNFPSSVPEALSDHQLRRNLRHATRAIRAKRSQVVEEVPDWLELTRAARAIKEEALRGLDRYLPELEDAVIRAGGMVHWARTSAEANQIVTRAGGGGRRLRGREGQVHHDAMRLV